jgi:hypothetical protein
MKRYKEYSRLTRQEQMMGATANNARSIKTMLWVLEIAQDRFEV